MAKNRFIAEQIIGHLLREAEVLLARGQTTAEVCRHLGTQQTYYRWRKGDVAGRITGAVAFRN